MMTHYANQQTVYDVDDDDDYDYDYDYDVMATSSFAYYRYNRKRPQILLPTISYHLSFGNSWSNYTLSNNFGGCSQILNISKQIKCHSKVRQQSSACSCHRYHGSEVKEKSMPSCGY